MTSSSASCDDLSKVLNDLVRHGSRIKPADQGWERYIGDLENVIQIQKAFNDICKNRPKQNELVIKVDDKEQALVEMCDSNLANLTKEAQGLVQILSKDDSEQKGIRKWLKPGSRQRSAPFPIETEKFQRVSQAAELAKSSLHLAFIVAVLSRTDSGQTETQKVIRGLEAEMIRPVVDSLKECISRQSRKVDEVMGTNKRRKRRRRQSTTHKAAHRASGHSGKERRNDNHDKPTKGAPRRESAEIVDPNPASHEDSSHPDKEAQVASVDEVQSSL
ncbi:hypothetical protein B0J13DRAFT_545868, partial [Dactylonectria estremocensis]